MRNSSDSKLKKWSIAKQIQTYSRHSSVTYEFHNAINISHSISNFLQFHPFTSHLPDFKTWFFLISRSQRSSRFVIHYSVVQFCFVFDFTILASFLPFLRSGFIILFLDFAFLLHSRLVALLGSGNDTNLQKTPTGTNK